MDYTKLENIPNNMESYDALSDDDKNNVIMTAALAFASGKIGTDDPRIEFVPKSKEGFSNALQDSQDRANYDMTAASKHVSFGERLVIKNLNLTPQQALEYLASNTKAGERDITISRSGVIGVKGPKEEKYSVIDPSNTPLSDPGLSGYIKDPVEFVKDLTDSGFDLAEAGGQAALMSIMGPAGVASVLGSGALSGSAASALTQGLRESIKGMMGIKEDSNSSNIAKSAMYGAASGMLAGAGGRLVKNGAYASPEIEATLKNLAEKSGMSRAVIEMSKPEAIAKQFGRGLEFNTPIPAAINKGVDMLSSGFGRLANLTGPEIRQATNNFGSTKFLQGEFGSPVDANQNAKTQIGNLYNGISGYSSNLLDQAEKKATGRFDTRALADSVQEQIDTLKSKASQATGSGAQDYYGETIGKLSEIHSKLSGNKVLGQSDINSAVNELRQIKPTFDYLTSAETAIPLSRDLRNMTNGNGGLVLAGSPPTTLDKFAGSNSRILALTDRLKNQIKSQNPEYARASNMMGETMSLMEDANKRGVMKEGSAGINLGPSGENPAILNELAKALDLKRRQKPNLDAPALFEKLSGDVINPGIAEKVTSSPSASVLGLKIPIPARAAVGTSALLGKAGQMYNQSIPKVATKYGLEQITSGDPSQEDVESARKSYFDNLIFRLNNPSLNGGQ